MRRRLGTKAEPGENDRLEMWWPWREDHRSAALVVGKDREEGVPFVVSGACSQLGCALQDNNQTHTLGLSA